MRWMPDADARWVHGPRRGTCHLCHLVIVDYQINADASLGLSSISFDSEKISEVATAVEVLWPPQCLIHLHTTTLDWPRLLSCPLVHNLLCLWNLSVFCCCLALSLWILCQSICCSHWPFILLMHVSPQRTGPCMEDLLMFNGINTKGRDLVHNPPSPPSPPLTKREGLRDGEIVWCVCQYVSMHVCERVHACVL